MADSVRMVVQQGEHPPRKGREVAGSNPVHASGGSKMAKRRTSNNPRHIGDTSGRKADLESSEHQSSEIRQSCLE